MSDLDKYGEAFRNLITEKTCKPGSIRELLKLNKNSDWRFICAAMDVLGGSESAIDSFLKFGLEGPCRYNDFGEKYLRLYGLLSATYIQQNSILELYKLMNVPGVSNIQKKVKALKIRQVRNKLASHSLDYKNNETRLLESFAPVQPSLNGFTCAIASLTLESPEEIDLKKEIEVHTDLLLNLMDKIYEKSYKTLFKNNDKKLEKHKKILMDLRVYKEGGEIIYTGDTEIVLDKFDSKI